MKVFWMGILLMVFAGAQAQAEAMGYVDLPKGCFGKQAYPCQVRVSGGLLNMDRGEQQFTLADGGSVSFMSSNEVQILSGGVWVRKSKDLLVRMSSLLKMQIGGEWFFEKQKDGLQLVRNLNGEVEFQSKQIFASEALPAGFQNWYGGLDSYGQVSRGVIRPIEMSAFLKQWLPVSGLSVAEMKKQIQVYREWWKDGLEISSQFYSQVANRRIAAVEERERKRQEAKVRAQNERLKIREMYRARQGLSGPEGL